MPPFRKSSRVPAELSLVPDRSLRIALNAPVSEAPRWQHRCFSIVSPGADRGKPREDERTLMDYLVRPHEGHAHAEDLIDAVALVASWVMGATSIAAVGIVVAEAMLK